LTKPSLITVDAMFSVVTHVGVRYTELTSALAWVSFVEALISVEGGVIPARR